MNKRIEDIVVGDSIKSSSEGDQDTLFLVTDMPGYSDLFIECFRALDESDGMYGLIKPEEITHINGEQVMSNETQIALTSTEMDELRAHAVNDLLTKANELLQSREDALPGIDPVKIDEVSVVLGALMDARIIEVVR